MATIYEPRLEITHPWRSSESMVHVSFSVSYNGFELREPGTDYFVTIRLKGKDLKYDDDLHTVFSSSFSSNGNTTQSLRYNFTAANRSLNEDAGRDEIYAEITVYTEHFGRITEHAKTNTVTGRF